MDRLIKKTDILFHCEFCGKQIHRNRRHYERCTKHFCSVRCRKLYNNPNQDTRLQGQTGIPTNEYGQIHQWIFRKYGKAIKCELCLEPDKNYEWALKKGHQYEMNIENFMQLCASCHRKYDDTVERRKKISTALKGKKANNCRSIQLTDKRSGKSYVFESIKDASKKLSLSRTAIQNVLSNSTKSTGGYLCHYL